MEKILGLDLGTNSIGWAIRDTSPELENQIIDKGVLTFDKGVAEVKGIETPKVQARTEARGKRRNYQAEKYRKWELLKILITNKMCPLSIEELNEWRHYSKGVGRKYPQSEKFIEWLRFDFDGDGKPDFERLGFSKHESYYLFRVLIIDESKKYIFEKEPHIIGRVLYQMVQRRGYNNIFNLIDSDSDESKTIMEGGGEAKATGVNELIPFIKQYKTLGAALYHIQKEKKVRIRKRYTLRTQFEDELTEICKVQNVENLFDNLRAAIIEQRPLRSQKGLIGYCTLEHPLKSKTGKYFKAGKKRIALSHPLYEEFRTWVDINNLKIEAPHNTDKLDFLEHTVYPMFNKASDFYYSNKTDKKNKETKGLKDKIENEGGIIHSKFDLELDEENEGKKYKANTFINKLEKIFGADWKEILKWNETLENKPKTSSYLRAEDIWHLVFDAIITKQQTSALGTRLIPILKKHLNNIEFNEKDFDNFDLQKGYASLSESTIKTILPYLKQGLLYSHAVFVANLEKVFNKKLENETLQSLKNEYEDILAKHKSDKEINSIVNGLISDRFNEKDRLGMGENYQLDNIDLTDIDQKIKDIYKTKYWNKKTDLQKETFKNEVQKKYQHFLQQPLGLDKGKQFYKQYRIEEKIIELLISKYGISENRINKFLWHPSEQETYPAANIKCDKDGVIYQDENGFDILFLGDPNPISRGFKNPMAIKTLQYLKKLINYLLLIQKIDSRTKIVVEIARELNDANNRKGIKKYQDERASKRKEFAKKIKAHYDSNGETNKTISDEIIDRYELWEEQTKKCLYCSNEISCADVFNGHAQIEHTIPEGISHCSELFNLTIAHSHCNGNKAKRIPTECDNYELIKKNVGFMYAKYLDYKAKLDDTYIKAKKAATKDSKDFQIMLRHYNKLHLFYWKKKYETFVLEEVTNQFRRQQLTDTQIITKYALPYLKTVFNKVEVQKGIITAEFRKIFTIQPKEEGKNRTKHSHHAIDAAVLTLIPPASIRDFMRKEFHVANENKVPYNQTPIHWDNYNSNFIRNIENEVLINFQVKYNTLITTTKILRKKGIKLKFKDENGNTIYRKATGDSVRGQLHDDTFFGAIKQPVYLEKNGKFIPQTDGKGNFIFQENKKRDDELFFVTKHREGLQYIKKIEDLELVIDPNLRAYLKKEIIERISKGVTFEEALLEPIWAFGRSVDKNGKPLNPIWHIRTRVKGGGGFVENPAKISNLKNFKSKKEHKNFIYANNGETLVCGLYETKNQDKTIRLIESFSILEIAKSKQLKISDAIPINKEITVKKEKVLVPLISALRTKTKVLFYETEISELYELKHNNILKRLYSIVKFEESRISFKHHLNSMSDEDLKNEMESLKYPASGASKFDFNFPIPKLRLSKDSLNFAIENIHFKINLDGVIEWIK